MPTVESDPNAAKILDPNESIKDIDIEMLIQGKREISKRPAWCQTDWFPFQREVHRTI